MSRRRARLSRARRQPGERRATAAALELRFAQLLADATASPLEARLAPFLGRELAGDPHTRWAHLRYGTRFGIAHPSPIVAQFSERPDRPGELYDQMLDKDTELAALVEKRIKAVLNLPRRIEPGDDSPRAREAAELCYRALHQVPSFAVNLWHQAEAVLKGVAIEEIVWEKLPRGPLAGALVPVDLIDRPMWRFAFLRREDRGWQLFVRRAGSLGLGAEGWLEPPPGKFLVYRRGTKDSPWGAARLDKCWWVYFLKKNGWKDFAIALQKWGSPTALGFYPTGGGGEEGADRAQQERLLALLETIQNDYALALPQGFDVKLLEATRGGSVSYAGFLQLCTRAQALLILGELDTSSAAEGPGSFAKAEVGNSVRLETVRLDAHELCSHLSETLLKWITDLNFGPQVPAPRFTIDVLEAEDRERRQQAMRATIAVGLPVARRDWYAAHQVREPAPGEAVVAPPVGATGRKMGRPGQFNGFSFIVPEGRCFGSEGIYSLARRAARATQGDPMTRRPPEGEPSGYQLPPAKAGSGAPFTGRQLVARRFTAGRSPRVSPALDQLAVTTRALTARLARLGAEASLEHAAHVRGQVAALAQSGELARPGGLAALAGRLDTRRHAVAIETTLVHGVGLALWRIEQAQGSEPLGRAPGLHLAAPPDPTSARTVASALDFWRRLLKLPSSLFELLTDALRFLSTAVAGVEDLALLARIHELLERALREGISITRDSGSGGFLELLAALFRESGLEPLADWHAELVHFQNLRNADAAVSYRQIVESPEGARLLPYLQLLTRGDDHVRELHQKTHGLIFATTHPFWKVWYPPNGFHCRCEVVPINAVRARRMGLVGAEPTGPWPLDPETGERLLPDPRFRSAPSFVALREGERLRAEQILQDAQTPGRERLFELLARLFEEIFG